MIGKVSASTNDAASLKANVHASNWTDQNLRFHTHSVKYSFTAATF